MLKEELIQRRKLFFGRVVYFGWPNQHASGIMVNLNWKFMYGNFLRTFALIVCAQPFCAGNATVICHASLRLTGPEDKHGVENAGEKNFRPSLLLWIIGDPYFFNHESLTILTVYKI